MWYAVYRMRDYEYFDNPEFVTLEGDYDSLCIEKRGVKTIGLEEKHMLFMVPAGLFWSRNRNPVYYYGFVGQVKC